MKEIHLKFFEDTITILSTIINKRECI